MRVRGCRVCKTDTVWDSADPAAVNALSFIASNAEVEFHPPGITIGPWA